jgi:hypothetical protein
VLRLLFCIAVVATVAQQYWTSPIARHHGETWKYAIDVAEANARADNAIVLMCSDLPEADFMAMPTDDRVKDSMLFAPLSYYKLSVPVVAMPRTLNHEAIRIGSAFLEKETRQHQRFLAMGFMASYPTLEWLAKNASANYDVRALGSFDEVKVLEFTPRK